MNCICKDIYFFNLSGCIQKDVIYAGSPLKRLNGNSYSNNYGETEDAAACQKICQETYKCEWFNWDKKGTCFLKKSIGNKKRVEPGGATGPPFCSGK